MKAPRLTKNASGQLDMLLEGGTFQWAEDGTQAAQHANVRLLLFKGELSHGGKLTTKTEGGTDWYGKVFPMDISQAEKELHLKGRILGTPGISSITEWGWSQTGHTVTITDRTMTDWGEVSVGGEVTPL